MDKSHKLPRIFSAWGKANKHSALAKIKEIIIFLIALAEANRIKEFFFTDLAKACEYNNQYSTH